MLNGKNVSSSNGSTTRVPVKRSRTKMSSILLLLSLILSLLLTLLLAPTHAATFVVVNQCTYTVWAAASPGGGSRLDPGQTWFLSVAQNTSSGRIWGRTNCNFDANGHGRCQTGDCDQQLDCSGFGSPPNTLVEFALFSYSDFLDISLVNGFNLPMLLRPITGLCRGIRCSDDINGQCPDKLKAPGGCNNPCTVFNTTEYCCNNKSVSCGSTAYSQFFKDKCPDAYTYPLDVPATITCPSGTNYKVTFCP
ncbi:hypothetical protein ACJRO7_018399 [Eucalyptus globulus]|uniref:Thaumatin-like protein n=1 Tax=Eucalyptus globulus TaxID=34317 RepID=A0ABD3KXW4_EUCGL